MKIVPQNLTKQIATLHTVDPQTGNKNFNNFDSDVPNLQNADLGNLWALLASASANVKTATVAKLECIFCKGSHQVQNCQNYLKQLNQEIYRRKKKCKK